mmetsp:Transcript_13056/g.41184  ORF Transcript_13056/g.41184 Transcript_13056/m.41184 type:complete len:250 (-) Transcript_13056:511-1260(-)
MLASRCTALSTACPSLPTTTRRRLARFVPAVRTTRCVVVFAPTLPPRVASVSTIPCPWGTLSPRPSRLASCGTARPSCRWSRGPFACGTCGPPSRCLLPRLLALAQAASTCSWAFVSFTTRRTLRQTDATAGSTTSCHTCGVALPCGTRLRGDCTTSFATTRTRAATRWIRTCGTSSRCCASRRRWPRGSTCGCRSTGSARGPPSSSPSSPACTSGQSSRTPGGCSAASCGTRCTTARTRATRCPRAWS